MGQRIDFAALGASLLPRARELLEGWLPQGRWSGHEYRIGSLAGEPGDSLSINSRTGVWTDFATQGVGGRDLVSLYAGIHGIPQGEAARELAGDDPPRPGAAATRPAEESPPVPLAIPTRPPTDAEMRHKDHGEPTHVWRYTTCEGALWYVTLRYPADEHGKKQFAWLTWNGDRWVKRAPRGPRPLYNLQALEERPQAPVLVVEGEKCADAAAALLPASVVVTWPGGGRVVDKADWTPLTGREVTLWPDADEAGAATMLALAQILDGHARSIRILDVEGQPAGWDIADAASEGWDTEQVIEWARPRVRAWVAGPAPDPDVPRGTAPVPAAPPEPREIPSHYLQMWDQWGLSLNGNGIAHCNVRNCVEAIRGLGIQVWFDEFSLLVMNGTRQWSDADTIELTVELQRRVHLHNLKSHTVWEAVQNAASHNRRHPPREWMKSLVWDGKERLPQLMSAGFGAEPSDYTAAVGRCWIVSMVARIMQPGCQVDTLPVFESPEGERKTSALKAIGGEWFTECHEAITGKDFFLILQGRMLVEISEMHAFKRADVDRIKGVITNRVDRFRPPYGRVSIDHPRSCVFSATTNRKSWNESDTGARRFLPIECGRINVGWIAAWRDQLFAEAVARYDRGEQWWDYPLAEALEQQEQRRERDEWAEVVLRYLNHQPMWDREMRTIVWETRPRSEPLDRVTVGEILYQALGIESGRWDRSYQLRVASILREMGWERRQIGTQRVSMFCRPITPPLV